MQESKPLIGKSKADSFGNVTKKLKYSNWASTLILIAFLGVACYFGYPYLLSNNEGRLSPQRIAAVSVENGYTTEAQADLITYLPNLQGEMNFNMFSGYLSANENREIFYWFEESQSDTSESDAVILWTNGGPGCSGLVGKLTEHGAYWVYEDLSLRSNPYAWNNKANMLYIEQPYGVGFSVTDEDSDYVSGDSTAVADIDTAIRSFLTKFPKFQSVDFILASESYGGHYMPLSAKQVLESNNAGSLPYVNLVGFLVGNPLSSYYHNEEGFLSATYGHGLVKESVYNDWVDQCYGNEEAILYSTACEVLYVKAYMSSYDADVYALDYPTCTLDDEDLKNKKNQRKYSTERKMFHNKARARANKLMKDESALTAHFEDDLEEMKSFQGKIKEAVESDSVPYLSCNTYYLVDYLNLEEVQSALHVKSSSVSASSTSSSSSSSSIDWDYCNEDVFDAWPDSDWLTSMKDTYLTLVNDYDIKILVYSGDDDSVCALQGTLTFMSELGLTVDSDNDWTEWKYQDQLAGFYTKYLDKDGNTAIHFQTVRSAGHMVPTTQPERALELLERFLSFYE